MKITLPWPPKELSPNARTHWGKKAKIAAKYRHACAILTKAANIDAAFIRECAAGSKYALHVFIDFYPPDRRERDDDNLVAAFKSGRDGVADALGIDDKHFVTHPLLREEVRKGGQVVLTLTLRERHEDQDGEE